MVLLGFVRCWCILYLLKCWYHNKDIEAMAKVNILPQQVQTIGTFFCKKKRGEVVLLRAGNFHYQLMPKFPCSSELSPKCSVTWPRHSWFQESDGRRLPFDLLALWISSRTSLSGPPGLGKGWKIFRPTIILTTCCGAIPVHSCFCQVNFCLPAGGMWWCT